MPRSSRSPFSMRTSSARVDGSSRDRARCAAHRRPRGCGPAAGGRRPSPAGRRPRRDRAPARRGRPPRRRPVARLEQHREQGAANGRALPQETGHPSKIGRRRARIALFPGLGGRGHRHSLEQVARSRLRGVTREESLRRLEVRGDELLRCWSLTTRVSAACRSASGRAAEAARIFSTGTAEAGVATGGASWAAGEPRGTGDARAGAGCGLGSASGMRRRWTASTATATMPRAGRITERREPPARRRGRRHDLGWSLGRGPAARSFAKTTPQRGQAGSSSTPVWPQRGQSMASAAERPGRYTNSLSSATTGGPRGMASVEGTKRREAIGSGKTRARVLCVFSRSRACRHRSAPEVA